MTEVDDGGEYVRAAYGVPAWVGGRVLFEGRRGMITGFAGNYVLIRLNDSPIDLPYHPTWHLTYDRIWHPCRLGGGPDCPRCVPPREERCPELGYNDRPCRVLGEHDIHRDGAGLSWFLEEADDAR